MKPVITFHGLLADNQNNKIDAKLINSGFNLADTKNVSNKHSYNIYAHSSGSIEALKFAVKNYKIINSVNLVCPLGIIHVKKPVSLIKNYIPELLKELKPKAKTLKGSFDLNRLLKKTKSVLNDLYTNISKALWSLVFDALPYLSFLNKKGIKVNIIFAKKDKLFYPSLKEISKLKTLKNVVIHKVKDKHAMSVNCPKFKLLKQILSVN